MRVATPTTNTVRPPEPGQAFRSHLQCTRPTLRFEEVFRPAAGQPGELPPAPPGWAEGGPADRKNFRAALPATLAETETGTAGRGPEGGSREVDGVRCDASPDGDDADRPEALPEASSGFDPWERRLAQPVSRPVAAAMSFEPTLAMLRRCVSSGDGRSGRVRLELGGGALEGSAVELVYDGLRQEISVIVELGAGADDAVHVRLEALRERLLERGLPVAGFQVLGDASEKPR